MDGDPLIYATSFVDNELVPVPVQQPMRLTGAWKELDFFEPRDVNISMMAREMEEEVEGGELVGEEEASPRSHSTQRASVAGSRSVEDQEQLDNLDRTPMTDFQWEQNWKHRYPVLGDRL